MRVLGVPVRAGAAGHASPQYVTTRAAGLERMRVGMNPQRRRRKVRYETTTRAAGFERMRVGENPQRRRRTVRYETTPHGLLVWRE